MTSFACPSLGIKCDAYPGRLFILIKKGKVNLYLVWKDWSFAASVFFSASVVQIHSLLSMVSLIYKIQEAKAKLSNCGKFLKTNLPSSYSNVMSGTGNDSL